MNTHYGKGNGNGNDDKHGNNSGWLIGLAIAAVVAVIAAVISVRDWLDTLTPLARGVAVVGIIAALLGVAAVVYGWYNSAPSEDKTLATVKAEVELCNTVMFWGFIVAVVCLFLFPFAQKVDTGKKQVEDTFMPQKSGR